MSRSATTPPRANVWALLAVSALTGAAAAGCGEGVARRPLTLPAEPLQAEPAAAADPVADGVGGDGGAEPHLWGLPGEELATQRIVKLHYQGPDGDATLNLVMRLERQDRFSLQGNDQLGRSWFRLAVEGSRALFLDLRGKTFCRFEESIEIAAVPLGPLPFDQLPALLLGRLPVEPVERVRRDADSWHFLDALGREWTAEAPEGRLERWTLWRQGEPEVWWQRGDPLSYLSARSEGLQLRWRTPAGQALTRAPAGLELPAGFVPGPDCAEGGGAAPPVGMR